MNLRQKYGVQRIIREVVINNKDKSLNELKRMIKEQIKIEINEEVALEIGIDEIVKVITTEGLLRDEYKEIPKIKNKYIKAFKEVEKERE